MSKYTLKDNPVTRTFVALAFMMALLLTAQIIPILVFNIGAAITARSSNPPLTGLKLERDNYMTNCIAGANQEDPNGNISDAYVENYCSCTYTDGIARYGEEGFTQKIVDLNKTNDYTELGGLMNNCVRKSSHLL